MEAIKPNKTREFVYTPLPGICIRSNWLQADQFNSFLKFNAWDNIKQYLQRTYRVTPQSSKNKIVKVITKQKKKKLVVKEDDEEKGGT